MQKYRVMLMSEMGKAIEPDSIYCTYAYSGVHAMCAYIKDNGFKREPIVALKCHFFSSLESMTTNCENTGTIIDMVIVQNGGFEACEAVSIIEQCEFPF